MKISSEIIMTKESENQQNLTSESLEAESGNLRKIRPKERNEKNRDYYDQKRIEKSKSTAHKMFISALWIFLDRNRFTCNLGLGFGLAC